MTYDFAIKCKINLGSSFYTKKISFSVKTDSRIVLRDAFSFYYIARNQLFLIFVQIKKKYKKVFEKQVYKDS